MRLILGLAAVIALVSVSDARAGNCGRRQAVVTHQVQAFQTVQVPVQAVVVPQVAQVVVPTVAQFQTIQVPVQAQAFYGQAQVQQFNQGQAFYGQAQQFNQGQVDNGRRGNGGGLVRLLAQAGGAFAGATIGGPAGAALGSVAGSAVGNVLTGRTGR